MIVQISQNHKVSNSWQACAHLYIFLSLPACFVQIFGRAAFAAHGKYFRLLHFTSDQSYGPTDQRAVLRFSFALPPAESMQDLTRLLSSVAAFTDILGNYKPSPDMRRRAEKVICAL